MPDEVPDVRLEWQPVPDDLARTLLVLSRERLRRRAVPVLLGCAAAAGALWFVDWTLTLTVVLSVTFALVLVGPIHRLQARSAWRASPQFRVPTTVDLTADGVRVTQGAIASAYRWEVWADVLETRDLLLLVGRGNGLMVLGVPTRAAGDAATLALVRRVLSERVGVPVRSVRPRGDAARAERSRV